MLLKTNDVFWSINEKALVIKTVLFLEVLSCEWVKVL